MLIEWDPKKARLNLAKHDVCFEKASTALLDPAALAIEDRSSRSEHRWILVGSSSESRLLTVVYTLREQERIRLISARRATRKEAETYAQGI